jgi:hypothetical protein
MRQDWTFGAQSAVNGARVYSLRVGSSPVSWGRRWVHSVSRSYASAIRKVVASSNE